MRDRRLGSKCKLSLEVLGTLRRHGRPMHSMEVANMLPHHKPESVMMKMAGLCVLKKLVRVSTGVYRLTGCV